MTAGLLDYLTAFSLAASAGTRGTIPFLLLGVFHHTSYFKLPARLLFLGRPEVIGALVVLLLLEAWFDAHPDWGDLSDRLAYVWKLVAGFLAFAAATGNLDGSVARLVTAGGAGAVTAGALHFLRNQVRGPARDVESSHETLGKIVSAGETSAGAILGVSSFVAPVVAAGLLGLGILGLLLFRSRAVGRTVPCPRCGKPVAPLASVCPHCLGER